MDQIHGIHQDKTRPRSDVPPINIDTSVAGGSQPAGAEPRTASIQPNPGDEALFNIENNPFTLTPGHLTKLIDPKSITVLHQLGGLRGLETGLRTNVQTGLSADETTLHPLASSQQPQPSNQAAPDRLPLPVPGHNKQDDSDQYASRRRVFGVNRLPERQSKSFLKLAWIALQDRVLILLSVAAAISLALGLYQTFSGHHKEEEGQARVEWIEGVAIIVAVLVVVIVGALNDWQKERQFRRLSKKKEDRCVTVVRARKAERVSVYDVLVGDVMVLEQGDVIPVDGVLIEGHNVSCDESSSTGESDVVKKVSAEGVPQALTREAETAKKDPFLLSGARVLEGVGKFLVTAVGPHSSLGRTMMALRDDPGMTPLQARLNVLADPAGYIAKLGSAAGLLLFTVLLIEFLARLPGNPASSEEKGQNFLRILITSITIIVVAVPEGLPLAVTLSLAFATKKMMKENNLVRHLQSCETMGNATVICSDKTGTLTENVMTVVGGSLGTGEVTFGDRNFTPAPDSTGISDAAKDPEDEEGCTAGPKQLPTASLASALHFEFQALIKESIAFNTTAFEGEENGKPVFIGTKTETALLDWARRTLNLGTLASERAKSPLVQLFPFHSQRKYMGSVIHLPGKYRLLVKGAPEVVLEQCSSVVADPTAALTTSELQKSAKARISKTISRYASLSLRTLALAYRDVDYWPPEGAAGSAESDQVEPADVFRDMIWIAVVGIQDPVREHVPAAVRDCRRAQVAVKMVTGDKVETARAVARECGIVTDEGGHVMEGVEFRRLSEEQRRARVRDLQVLARSSPEDKRVLVESLRALGEVVAVTGDGTNDAPALKAADVGFSMGVMGTEVAKEASDIILMDDNFSSIVKALAWGRAINDAVKKFLQFQITVNITAVFLTFISAVASSDERSVLNAIQLLWVNLIMDTFAALALATDPPNGSLLDRAPEPRTAPLITLTMWKMILGQSVYQLAVGLTLHFAGPSFLPYPEPELRTLVFNTFVFMQIFKLINSRRIDNKLNIFEGLHRNHLFILMITIMSAGQLLIIFLGGDAFVVVRLNGAQWAISLVLGLMSIPVGILIRLIPDDWVRACVRWLPRLPQWRRKRVRVPDEEIDVRADAAAGRDFGDALITVRDDLAFLKRVRGGRIVALNEAIAIRPSVSERRVGQTRRSKSPMQSAVGMPGLLAASIAASPVARLPSSPSPLSREQSGG
ncbi:calcium-translocating P-type ATPase [Parathielavia appendiculata]|uniref:Calcium-transporting ATPase n=1 Tax=Parathielavia appendiculata TaxID=2587402 RepID=A0AAN6Z896_9PEZI|nr:calcium-translocating P-type ATPase [Parathielavia appendiculata]